MNLDSRADLRSLSTPVEVRVEVERSSWAEWMVMGLILFVVFMA